MKQLLLGKVFLQIRANMGKGVKVDTSKVKKYQKSVTHLEKKYVYKEKKGSKKMNKVVEEINKKEKRGGIGEKAVGIVGLLFLGGGTAVFLYGKGKSKKKKSELKKKPKRKPKRSYSEKVRRKKTKR